MRILGEFHSVCRVVTLQCVPSIQKVGGSLWGESKCRSQTVEASVTNSSLKPMQLWEILLNIHELLSTESCRKSHANYINLTSSIQNPNM